MKAKSGEWRYVYSCGKIIERDENGKPLKAVGIQQDITRIKETEKALKESLERFQLVAKSTSDLIYVRDIETGSVNWYGDIDKVLGFKKEEFPRTVKGWLDQIHPRDKKRIEELANHHRKSPHIHHSIGLFNRVSIDA